MRQSFAEMNRAAQKAREGTVRAAVAGLPDRLQRPYRVMSTAERNEVVVLLRAAGLNESDGETTMKLWQAGDFAPPAGPAAYANMLMAPVRDLLRAAEG
jgi:hypothetical protein